MEIKIFESPKFGEIRTSLGVSNEPFFCLSDVCKALELKNSRDVKARLNPKGVSMTDTLTNGGFQQLTDISSYVLYSYNKRKI